MFPLLQFRNRKTGTRAEASFFTPDFIWDTVRHDAGPLNEQKILLADPTRVAIALSHQGNTMLSFHYEFIRSGSPIFYLRGGDHFVLFDWDHLGALIGNEWYIIYDGGNGILNLTTVSFRPKQCPSPGAGE